jgi:hypothetical protein
MPWPPARLGGLVDLLEHPVGAHPEVAERVDDDDLVPGAAGGGEGVDEDLRAVAVQVEGVEGEQVRVLGGGAVFGVDDGDAVAEHGGEHEGGVGLAGAGGAVDGDAAFGGLLGGLGEAEARGHRIPPQASFPSPQVASIRATAPTTS